MTKENIDPIIRGRIMRLRKYLAIVLITVFSLFLCFALAGCDDEDNEPEQKIYSDFELYHGDRYLKEYTYFYTRLYKYDEKYETYRRVYTNWDAVYPGNPDDLKGYDYLLYYRDGKSDNEEWNAIFLKGKEYIKAIGETITISMTDMTFDGTLGAIPIEFCDSMSSGFADVELILTEEEENNLFLQGYYFAIRYNPPKKGDGNFLMSFWTKPTEIAGKKYKMNFHYTAALEPGDMDWSDSLAGKVE